MGVWVGVAPDGGAGNDAAGESDGVTAVRTSDALAFVSLASTKGKTINTVMSTSVRHLRVGVS